MPLPNAKARGFSVTAAYAVLAALASSATAAETVGQSWQFEFTPYLFGAGLNGNMGLRGVIADVDVPVEKLVKHLDSAFMANFEARKEKWFFAFDAFYVRLEGQRSGSWSGPFGIGSATADLNVKAKQQIYQPSVGHRVFDDATTFDVIGAARYTKIDSGFDLAVTTGGLLPGGTPSMSGSESWWDPVIGARVKVPLAEHWSVNGYADVGGFGVGSELSYQVVAGVDWQFAKDFSAKAGYRYLHQDFEDNGFVWDMALQGFYVGLGIRF